METVEIASAPHGINAGSCPMDFQFGAAGLQSLLGEMLPPGAGTAAGKLFQQLLGVRGPPRVKESGPKTNKGN